MPRYICLAFAVILAVALSLHAQEKSPTETTTRQFDLKSPALCAAWAHDGKLIAVGANDGVIHLIDPSAGKIVRTIKTDAPVGGIAFSHDGQSLAIRQIGKTMSLWDVKTGAKGRVGGFANYRSDLIAFKPDGQTVIATAPGEFVQWQVKTGGASGSKSGLIPADSFAAVASDGSLTAWSTPAGMVQMRALNRGTNLQVGPSHSLAIGPEAKQILVGSTDKSVHIWNHDKREKVGALTGLPRPAAKLSISGDGTTVVGMTADSGILRVWDLARNRTRRQLTNLHGALNAIALAPDGKSLVTAGADGKALVWNVATRELAKLTTPVKLSDEEMRSLWDELASTNFDKSDAAWRKLATGGDLAVAFLKQQVRPIAVPAVDRAKVDKLIGELNSATYAARENATRELIKTGELVIVPLEKFLETSRSPEAQRRASLVLKTVREPVLTPDRLRVLEAIELLEQLQSASSKKLLQEIADEALIVQIRDEAVQALRRMTEATPKG
jgi:hypothetical protein